MVFWVVLHRDYFMGAEQAKHENHKGLEVLFGYVLDSSWWIDGNLCYFVLIVGLAQFV